MNCCIFLCNQWKSSAKSYVNAANFWPFCNVYPGSFAQNTHHDFFCFSLRAALLALLCMLSALVLAATDAPPAARPALKLSLHQDLAVASRAAGRTPVVHWRLASPARHHAGGAHRRRGGGSQRARGRGGAPARCWRGWRPPTCRAGERAGRAGGHRTRAAGAGPAKAGKTTQSCTRRTLSQTGV